MIIQSPDNLKIKSNDFVGTDKDFNTLINCLEYELQNSPTQGVGLSAIQIGIPERVAIIRLTYKVKTKGWVREVKQNYDLYNATIIEKSQPFIHKDEGCLSFPGKFIDTQRYNRIKLRNGDGKEYDFSGLIAIVVQHELDHWNGVVYLDRQAK